MNSAPTLADFESRWLLLVDSGTVVHLWNVDGKIGYVDRTHKEPNHWIWLTGETLSRIRPVSHIPDNVVIRPDFELEN